jgi:3-oxoadipate enol-lactonase
MVARGIHARADLIWQQAHAGGIPAAKESWLAHPFFAPAQRDPKVAARLARIIDQYSDWHFVNANPEQSLTPPAAGRLAELTMPLLVMVGEHDIPDFVQMTELICRQVPHAQQYIVPGVGHMANMEAPKKVTKALLEFLDCELRLSTS